MTSIVFQRTIGSALSLSFERFIDCFYADNNYFIICRFLPWVALGLWQKVNVEEGLDYLYYFINS